MSSASLHFSFPERVNERAARVVASVVAVTLAVALATAQAWLVPVLAVGFVLRVGWGPRFSPLARLAMWTAGRLWSARPVPGKPKRFAQGVGAACTLAASVLLFAGTQATAVTTGWALVAMVAVFASLEAGLGWCAGCFMFAGLQRVGLVRADDCPQCVGERS
ncbi:MAG: DUF4395 domain-containing protein [Myxococcales bacterium]|nr:DUF4395 domain-containing protein [Myxococcales bacterium]